MCAGWEDGGGKIGMLIFYLGMYAQSGSALGWVEDRGGLFVCLFVIFISFFLLAWTDHPIPRLHHPLEFHI